MTQPSIPPGTPADLRDLVDSVLSFELPPIVHAGHPVLRTPALPFDGQLDDAVLSRLLATMRRVMHAAPGVGLAAPQIGIPLRIAVLEDEGVEDDDVAAVRLRTPLPFLAVVNPSYAAAGADTAAFYEGCLSVPGYQAVVERHRDVDLTYTRPDGRPATERFSGWPARIIQHETDHLNGRLYLDKAMLRSLTDNSEHARRWSQPGIDGARAALGF